MVRKEVPIVVEVVGHKPPDSEVLEVKVVTDKALSLPTLGKEEDMEENEPPKK